MVGFGVCLNAVAGQIHNINLQSEGDVLRLQLETDSGVIENAGLLPDGSGLVIKLKGVDKAQLEQRLQTMKPSHPLLKSIRSGSAGQQQTDLLLSFASRIGILDETMSASANGHSAWEIVLGPNEDEDDGEMAAGRTLDLSWKPEDDASSLAEVMAEQAKGANMNLMDAYDRALANDAKYGAAKADFKVSQEAFPQALAGYLPTASYDFQISNIWQSVASRNPVYAPGSSSYGSNTSALTISQPIIKVPAYIKIEQADVSIEQAKLALVASEQDLILRLAGSYLNFLAAQDAVGLAKAEKQAMAKQFDLAQMRMGSGLGTISQVHETEARYMLSQAREIDAINKLDDARGALKEIVGIDVGALKSFEDDFEAATPQPSEPDAWVRAALEQNLSLQARGLALEIAGLEIRRQQAGYLPTVSLAASHIDQDTGGSVFGRGSNVTTDEVGMKLNFPFFEGGMTRSMVREAEARREKAMQEREQEYRKTERMARSSILSVVSSIQTMSALRRAVLAQENTLETKLKGLRSGVNTSVQVVDAYRLYYGAQRDFLQARYDYLLNRLKLKQSIGTLSRQDLEVIAELLG
jgi:outer membrane protein